LLAQEPAEDSPAARAYTVDGPSALHYSHDKTPGPASLDKTRAILVKSQNSETSKPTPAGGTRGIRPASAAYVHLLLVLLVCCAVCSGRCVLLAGSSPPSAPGLVLNTSATAAHAGSPGLASVQGPRSPSNIALAPPTVNQLFAAATTASTASTGTGTGTGSVRPPSPVAALLPRGVSQSAVSASKANEELQQALTEMQALSIRINTLRQGTPHPSLARFSVSAESRH
jgi:hypothetical protein